METIKVGIKINLEMKPVVITANTMHKRVLGMNFYNVDQIKTLDYINSVIVYENDFKYISLIIKFCHVTNKPIKFYIKNELSEKVIQKLNKYKIKYYIFNDSF